MPIDLKSCPDTMRPHAQKVLSGEYSVPVAFRTPPRILDIGANVGAFTLWASAEWPGALVTAFEPHPDNAAAWRENCAHLITGGRVNLVEAAVTDAAGEADLFDGPNNCGEASVMFRHGTPSHRIKTVPAQSLQKCQVLKIDAEGCEPIVLANYPFVKETVVIMLEFHSAEDRDRIIELLNATHRLGELQNWLPQRGVMKWIRR